MLVLCLVALVSSALPAIVFFINLRLYRKPPLDSADALLSVSVLIPARNEELSISGAIQAVLASTNVDLELIVLDDGSVDRTAYIVSGFAQSDERVRLVNAPPLPDGWCGKQFACHTLSGFATKPILCFLDADVRVAHDGVARAAGFLERSGAALASGFPHQETETLLEQMLIPLMHFLLLGFLPVWRMRAGRRQAYAAGCGQFMIVRREAYLKAGGHAAIRSSRHDGIMLPKAFRRKGLPTDLCDLTDAASCRMYTSAREVINGLLKNATEGIAAPARIVPISILLAAGQILPFALLPFCAGREPLAAIALAGVLCVYLPRLAAAIRFRQPLAGALLHPVSMLLLLLIQWCALLRLLTGTAETWKGRSYSPTA